MVLKPQRHAANCLESPSAFIDNQSKHLSQGGTQNRHQIWWDWGKNWHFRLFSGHGNGKIWQEVGAEVSSVDIFSAQLSRVSIRYILYLRAALCLRLNAVWGAICIPLSLSQHIYVYLHISVASMESIVIYCNSFRKPKWEPQHRLRYAFSYLCIASLT